MNCCIVLQFKLNLKHPNQPIGFLLLGKHLKYNYSYLLLKFCLILLLYYIYRLKRRILDSPQKNKVKKQVEFRN